MRTFFSLILIWLLAALPAQAQSAPQTDRLIKALRLDEDLAVMRTEGIDYTNTIDKDMLAGRGGAAWKKAVAGIYDLQRMEAFAHEAFAVELEGRDIAAMIAFFESDLGRRIVSLELSARQALLDKDIEAASKQTVEQMRSAGDPRLELIRALIEAGDMINLNVASALNSNYAFYLGLTEGGDNRTTRAPDEILNDVWAQEPAIRKDTKAWLYSYLVLAYGPLSDDDLRAYLDFSRSPPGEALNAALFSAFDQLFANISRRLGAAVGQIRRAEDL